MKLSKETIEILKNFSQIYSGVVLKEGNVVMTKSITNMVYAEAELNHEIDEEIAVYDLPSFLGSLNLVGDGAEITLNRKSGWVEISNERVKINYPATDSSSVIQPKARQKKPESHVDYVVSADDMKQIMRMARQLKVSELEFFSASGRMFIRGWEKVDKEHPNEMFCLDMGEYAGSETFNFFIRLSNMVMIDGDYVVSFRHVAKNGASFACAWFATEGVNYMVACEKESTSQFV